MKRSGMILALLIAGTCTLGMPRPSLAATPSCTSVTDAQEPTETEKRVLKQAAPMLEISYPTLLDMHAHGLVTVEHLEGNTYRVTVYLEDGGTVISELDDIL